MPVEAAVSRDRSGKIHAFATAYAARIIADPELGGWDKKAPPGD
ncbi:hypothetical protein [Rosistilla oblonga]